MKRLWPLAVLAPAIFVVVIFSLFFARNRGSELPTETYANYADADAHGAFALPPRGWLPTLIPQGATSLRAGHNPSTHQTWGEFIAPRPDWAPAATAKESPTELMLPGPPAVLDWWPALLRGRVASGDLQLQGFRIYFLDTERSPLVVAVRGAQVYWWRLARQ